jgi:hypothetical protein
MALIRRKDGRKADSAAPPAPISAPTTRVQVKIEGPDAERLASLLDIAAVVETLREHGVDPDDVKEPVGQGRDQRDDGAGDVPPER